MLFSSSGLHWFLGGKRALEIGAHQKLGLQQQVQGELGENSLADNRIASSRMVRGEKKGHLSQEHLSSAS